MPCGQKKRRSEMIQSQMVTPPLAAMEGTTFRLKTATTNRRTRSRRPRARIRWGWVAGWVVVDKASFEPQRPKLLFKRLGIAALKTLRHPNVKPTELRSADSRGRLSPHV